MGNTVTTNDLTSVELVTAVMRNDVDRVTTLLQSGASLDVCNHSVRYCDCVTCVIGFLIIINSL